MSEGTFSTERVSALYPDLLLTVAGHWQSVLSLLNEQTRIVVCCIRCVVPS
jgi:hypothetical protein